MKRPPLITIITVSYNAVRTIENTILSVLNQVYLDIEYIIIDGGSTDGTLDIIKKYQEKIAYWVKHSYIILFIIRLPFILESSLILLDMILRLK